MIDNFPPVTATFPKMNALMDYNSFLELEQFSDAGSMVCLLLVLFILAFTLDFAIRVSTVFKKISHSH